MQGLELGADDYITKPFDIEELTLRLFGAIRRTERQSLTDPRTGLPASKLTEEELRHVIRTRNWAILDLQINHFDTFKELYGFVAADYVLRFTTLLIGEILDDFSTKNNPSSNTSGFFSAPEDFVGHVGECNFFIITSAQSAPAICKRLKERFLNEVQTEYNFEDRERGFMLMRKSQGIFDKVPLMSLSIGLVQSESDMFADIHEIMRSAVQARLYDEGTTT